MLYLTRKPGQSINIGNDIVVTVLAIKGDQVRLGITAPRETGVFREEIYLRMQNESEVEHVD